MPLCSMLYYWKGVEAEQNKTPCKTGSISNCSKMYKVDY